jgi:hypothetical protein
VLSDSDPLVQDNTLVMSEKASNPNSDGGFRLVKPLKFQFLSEGASTSNSRADCIEYIVLGAYQCHCIQATLTYSILVASKMFSMLKHDVIFHRW